MKAEKLQRAIFEEQLQQHKSMTCQDGVKMCYQACFGPGHLLKDREKAWEYYVQEYEEVIAMDGALYEEISADYIRINLAPYKYREFAPEWLFQMFFLTANEKREERASFSECLELLRQLAEEKKTSFSVEEWDEYVEKYLEENGGAVHHSEAYRECENPHYRVVSSEFIKVLPVLEIMAKKQKKSDDEVMVLRIEGRAASGKTTMAKLLAEVVDGAVIEMDHFFLPPVLRTPERLREVGGNIHYEYYEEAVVPYIKKNEVFSYDAFDCSIMKIGKTVEVAVKPWRIVEGVYCSHPRFGDYADVTIFMNVDADVQVERIRKRNGEAMLKRFQDAWIPMEEAFFAEYKGMENADCVIRI